MPVVKSGMAGVIAAMSFEPLGIGWLAPAAMAILWHSMRRDNAWHPALAGATFGLTFASTLMWWLAESIGVAAWIALTIAVSAASAVAVVAGSAMRFLPGGAFWAAVSWTAIEELRSNWPLGGMPWGRLGVAAIDTPWEPLLPYLGVSGTSLITAWVGFAAAELCLRPRKGTLALTTVPIVVVMLTAAAPPGLSDGSVLTVAVVQGGVPGDGTKLATHHRQVTQNHIDATLKLAERLKQDRRIVDVVVWPENSTAVDPLSDPSTSALIRQVAAAIDAPLLVGGIFDGPTPVTAYNRGVLFKTDGTTGDMYTKTHLVPFGEYIPWRSVVGSWSQRFDEIPRDMLPGQADGPIDVDGVSMAVAICFDIAYDNVLARQVDAGAQFAVVQTSNATFFGTTQPDQQFEITRAKAVELGRTIVVASTNGVSGVIGADGAVVSRLPVGVTGTLVADVKMYSHTTPAVRSQSIRQAVLIGLLALGLALSLTMSLRNLIRRRMSAVRRPTC